MARPLPMSAAPPAGCASWHRCANATPISRATTARSEDLSEQSPELLPDLPVPGTLAPVSGRPAPGARRVAVERAAELGRESRIGHGNGDLVVHLQGPVVE